MPETMPCPHCGHENRAQARFCAGCGAAVERVCAACGAALPAGARFCDACGQAASVTEPAAPVPSAPATGAAPGVGTPRPAEKILTSRSALEGERKLVTVLFADVAGFTALSTRLDPEDLHGIMDGCFQRVMEAVHRYEGTVNQFTGDGVMALFGAPIAHEDHAVRAVAAALAIQRDLGTYAEELRRGRGIEFGMRIGLNTGWVVVGKIGDDLRMDYTAQGETVNLAARLQAAAATGGVLVSEGTHRLIERHFVCEARGALELKGLGRPVEAFAVTAERARRGRFDVAVERGLTPLVGRSRELGFLQDCFERVRGGHGQVVSLVGDAGVGKSRVAHELARWLEQRGAAFLKAACLPHGEAAPFQVVVELLQVVFRLEKGETAAAQAGKVERELGRLEPALAWAVPHLKHLLALPASELEAEGLDQAQRKRRTLEAIKAFLFRSAEERPVVLLIEDLHWIDRSSEEALRALVDGLAEHRVLLLCTHRPGAAPPWQDRTFHQRLALEALSEAETREMAGHLLGPRDAASIRDRVVRRAEGNPFFLEELAGYLRRRERGEKADGEVPETIHDLLTARIDRLPEPLKRTLQHASVLGREFPLGLLEAISAPEEEALRACIAELVTQELLQERALFPEVLLAFAQPLLREVAYQGLLLKSRGELHGRAGRALESSYAGRTDEVLADLARHFARSSERTKAVQYLVRSGERAASLFAYAEAEASYREALAVVDEGSALAAERPEVLERLGDVAFAQGVIARAVECWSAALGGRPGDSPARRRADLFRKLGVARFAAGERDQALAEFAAGLAALDGELENLEAARLHHELARIRFRLGDNRGATEAAERALDLGRRLAAPDVVSHAYNTLGVALARAGELERGAATVAQSLETALGAGLAAVACRAYTNLAVVYTTLDHQRSADYCREGLALARRIGDQLQQSWLFCALASGHCTLAGDYDEGVKAAEAAAELDERLGQRGHLPIPLIILAQIYQCRGDYARSREQYHRALAVAETVGEPQLLFPCYDGLATLAIEDGDEAEAERWLEQSRAVQARAGGSSEGFFVMPFLC